MDVGKLTVYRSYTTEDKRAVEETVVQTVSKFLQEHATRYTANINVGRSGNVHIKDIVLPSLRDEQDEDGNGRFYIETSGPKPYLEFQGWAK